MFIRKIRQIGLFSSIGLIQHIRVSQNKNVEKSGYAVLSKSWVNNKGGIFNRCGGYLTNLRQSVDEISIFQIIFCLIYHLGKTFIAGFLIFIHRHFPRFLWEYQCKSYLLSVTKFQINIDSRLLFISTINDLCFHSAKF